MSVLKMSIVTKSLVLILIGQLLPAAVLAGGPDTTGTDSEQELAAATLLPFKQKLKKTLVTEISSGGPLAALNACNLEASGIAVAASTQSVRVGRTSHKLRNPANAPADWMQPLLAKWQANPAEAAPVLLDVNGVTAYAEPILTGELCLVCHGSAEQIPEAVQARLDVLYPDDAATGFSAGELRGMFWAEFTPAVTEAAAQ